MTYLAEHLTAAEFAGVVGFDPYNEPHAGSYDSGQTSRTWETRPAVALLREVPRPHGRGRAGRTSPPSSNRTSSGTPTSTSRSRRAASSTRARIGPRYVFNTHFYDQKAISGIFMWGKAADGQYANDFGAVRDRAAAAGTAAIVSEFGHPLSRHRSPTRRPTVHKAMYQALDSRLPGASWWSDPAASGPVLSGTQWQWDIYNGRHHELMNGNPDKVLTDGDAWNDEDLSAVRLDDSGTAGAAPGRPAAGPPLPERHGGHARSPSPTRTAPATAPRP